MSQNNDRKCIKPGCDNVLDPDQGVCDLCGTTNPVPQQTQGEAAVSVVVPTPPIREPIVVVAQPTRGNGGRRRPPRRQPAAPAATPPAGSAPARFTTGQVEEVLDGEVEDVLPSIKAKVFLEGVQPFEADTLERGERCTVPVRVTSFGIGTAFGCDLSNGRLAGAVTGFDLRVHAGYPRLVIKLRVDAIPASGGVLIPPDGRIQVTFGNLAPVTVHWLGDGPTAYVGYDFRLFHIGQRGTVQTVGDPVPSVVHSLALRMNGEMPELLVTLVEPPQRPCFCAHCGNELGQSEGSCPRCGTVRGQSAPPSAAPAPQPTPSAAPPGVVVRFQPIQPPASATASSQVVGWSGGQAPQPTPPVPTPPAPVVLQVPVPAAPAPASASQFRAPTPVSKLWWVQQGTNVNGPYDPNQLKEFIRDGKIIANDLVQHPRTTANQWRRLGDISWLAALLPAPAAPQSVAVSGHQTTHVKWMPPGDGGQPAPQPPAAPPQPAKYSAEWVYKLIRCETCGAQLQPYPNNRWCPNATCAAPQQYS